MAKEEVQEAVVEEPTNTEEYEDELSPWYYFFSEGCGWCKKANPVVEELNKDGYDILMLDLAEPDNAKLQQELKDEFGVQCGTPWFLNADTGKGVCGFREKDVLETWLAGEDVPEPPRPKGPPPQVPFHGASTVEEKEFTKQHNKWLKENDHLPKKMIKTAKQILALPRAKSNPPQPPNLSPQTINTITETAIDDWGIALTRWSEENDHLPKGNRPPVDKLVENMKNRRNHLLQDPDGVPQRAPQQVPQQVQQNTVNTPQSVNTLDAKVQALEVKITKLMDHFGVK